MHNLGAQKSASGYSDQSLYVNTKSMKLLLTALFLLCAAPLSFAQEGDAPVDDTDLETEASSREAAAVDGADEDFAGAVRTSETPPSTSQDVARPAEAAFDDDEDDANEDTDGPLPEAHDNATNEKAHTGDNPTALSGLPLHIPAPPHTLVSPELIKQAKELDEKKKKKNKKKCQKKQATS
ncbi:MAG: hypothetical protein C0514_07430 [Candidatus Puniceispirillum sp.]|nr:hypothetical protein [Candidatus Puniceispirillum sp.]